MLHIDKFTGNAQDKYNSKCVIEGFDFHFDTIENNLDFAYYCLRYHLRYLKETYLDDSKGLHFGKKFGFHYHIKETNEWHYFETSLEGDDEIDVIDFLDNKINPRISMSASTKVFDEKDIEILNNGFSGFSNT